MNQQNFYLQPFTSISSLDLQIHGKISRDDNNLTISYIVQGDVEKIDIPILAGIPTRKHELWQETCWEFFLGIQDSPGYWEFNLSPTGNWNVYRFDDYRQGMREETAITSLPFTLDYLPEALELTLELDLDQLIPPEQNINIAITTVVQDINGIITYWALDHIGEEADFHLRDSFTINFMGVGKY